MVRYLATADFLNNEIGSVTAAHSELNVDGALKRQDLNPGYLVTRISLQTARILLTVQ